MNKLVISAVIGGLLFSSGAFADNHLGCSVDKTEKSTVVHSHDYNKSYGNYEKASYDKNHSKKTMTNSQLKERMQSVVNRASVKQLESLLGIIPKYAEMISTTHPRYWVLEDLMMMIEKRLGTTGSDSTIVDLAVGTPDLSILVDVVTALGLADTLSSGEYTVFAPTNQAFEVLLSDLGMTFDELASNTELLKTVVLYHVVEGTVKASDVVGLTEGTLVPTVGGESVRVSNWNGVFVDESEVIATDIMASNGVVHLVDSVLLPPSVKEMLGIDTDRGEKDIVTTAVESGAFPTLVAAIEAAGLVETLQGEGPFTVYAPSEEAFANALTALGLTAEQLLNDKETLTSVLTYHVVPGFYTAEDIVGLDGQIMSSTVNGAQLIVNPNGGSPMINGANILNTDIYTTNGVIHVIDAVLLP